MFDSRVGILTSVLIAMGYFFRCQKKTFDLESNKCICHGNFAKPAKLDLLTPEFVFELCICQGYIQNFERNWKD